MARLRTLKPGFFTNDALAEIEPLGRLLFQGLWCLADRAGRLEDRPRKIKAEVLPYDDCDADRLLSELAARGFIVRYEVAGLRYIQVVNFGKHQTPHIKEAESTIPAPDMHGESTVPAPPVIGNQLLGTSSGEWEPDTTSVVPPSGSPSEGDIATPTSVTAAAATSARASSPRPVPKPKERASEYDATFARFWEAWPKKVAKQEALTAWRRLGPDPPLVDAILAAIPRHVAAHRWDDPSRREYIPHPATWLNAWRWEDELPEPTGLESVLSPNGLRNVEHARTFIATMRERGIR